MINTTKSLQTGRPRGQYSSDSVISGHTIKRRLCGIFLKLKSLKIFNKNKSLLYNSYAIFVPLKINHNIQ